MWISGDITTCRLAGGRTECGAAGQHNEGLYDVEVGRWGGDGPRAHRRIGICSKSSSGNVMSIVFELHSPQYSEELE